MTATHPGPPPAAPPAGASLDPARLATDAAAWDTFVAGAAAPSHLQVSAWAVAKAANGWAHDRLVVPTGDGRLVGAQLLLRRPRPLPRAFAYAPRGPIGQGPLDEAAIEAFTAAVRAWAARRGVSHVRVDPEAEDPDGTIARALRRAGWRRAPSIQPVTTRILDLDRPQDAIWEDIHRKWRQSIRKAGRDGTSVVPAGADRIGAFHRLYRRSMDRAGIPARTERTFADLYHAFGALGLAHLFFAVSPDGDDLATMLLLGCGAEVADLYGGMSDEGARQRANYLVKWEAIRAVRAAGHTRYDLWGLPSGAVAAFKAGWGGREVRWVGAWDLVIDPLGRLAFEAAVAARDRWVGLRHGGRRAGAGDGNGAA